jgi:mRNA degradation ribonuclease J1/J2
VHGEAAFLYAHAELARAAGVSHTSVIHNGQMLGVGELRSRSHVSSGSTAAVRATQRCAA